MANTRDREYWYWVTACANWAIEAQDRYYCTLEGKIVCRDGWQFNMCNGPMCAYLETKETFCNVPICSEGCHPRTGYCDIPYECLCKDGYMGDNCTEPITMSSCKNGVSTYPDKHCNCEPGWEGDFCDEPQCLDGCSNRHGFCEMPDECLCRTGWQGNLCDECVPYPGCDTTFGSCEDPWECNCSSGYTGTYCNETISVE